MNYSEAGTATGGAFTPADSQSHRSSQSPVFTVTGQKKEALDLWGRGVFTQDFDMLPHAVFALGLRRGCDAHTFRAVGRVGCEEFVESEARVEHDEHAMRCVCLYPFMVLLCVCII